METSQNSLSPTALVLRYAGFAGLATLANLAAQRLVLAGIPGQPGFVLAVICGTGAGLVLKYLLDKRWIFFDQSGGIPTHARKFALYTAMGIVTTLIFWAAETAAWVIWQTHAMREAGAVAGLTVGYVVKYRLDRRYVFGRAGRTV
ncbi:GtrA family protein [Thalassovita aquimarina]|uniref:GtrA family protein n=1 Tax=Thalassovita aquimarina TaxID=2785917 RepID=UPI001FE4DD7A|nr:GtrA family protein [Thalassovita aquimarina]